MARFPNLIFVYIFLAAMAVVHGQEKRKKPIVVIDPGHGGSDKGAIGVNGLEEKTVALGIAMEVIRLNRELYAGSFEVYSTRYADTLISLRHRTKLAKALNADVFISVHCNRSDRKTAQGVEVYIRPDNQSSEQLANLFLERLHYGLGYKNCGVYFGNFQVLRESADFPSVLMELGFLSNAVEAAHHEKASSVSAIALLILEILKTFIGYD